MHAYWYLGTTKAVAAIVTEITIATADGNGSTVVATGGIGLEIGKQALLPVIFLKDRAGPFQDGIINTDVRTPGSGFATAAGTVVISLAVAVVSRGL